MRLFLFSLLIFAALAFDVEGESTASVSVSKDGQETSMAVNGEGDGMVGASLDANEDGTIEASTVNEEVQPKRVFKAHSSAFQYSFASSVMVVALTRLI